MRHVVTAVLVTWLVASDTRAQTPEPVTDSGSNPDPQPTPVPVPVPVTEAPKPEPAPPPAPPPAAKPEPPRVLQSAEIPLEGAEIKAIIVEDNKKTTSDTVELIAGIEVGDTWRPDMVDAVKGRLVSSGLFKDVEVFWTKQAGGVAVHILAKDKHSWVIAPAFYNQPTNTGGGVGFGENNLFGQNQKLLLYGQIATGDSFFIGAWVNPSLGGTRFYSQLDTYLKSARNIEYSPPNSYVIEENGIRPVRESRMHYLNLGAKLGVELWRGVKLDARIRGAKINYVSVKTLDEALPADLPMGTDPAAPPNPGGEGYDVSNEWTLTIDRRANWYGIQDGHKYNFSFEHSLPSLGSDFLYWLAGAGAYKAIRILERHNLVYRANIGYGHNLPFQQEYVTGGTSMRGWLNNEFRGNFRALANIEYSFPIFTIAGFSVRGLGFWDSAYTTFTKTDDVAAQRNYLPGSAVRGFDGFKNSVGIGTRFYLRQIVLPLLGLDFGYGLEARDFQVYLAIGLTD